MLTQLCCSSGCEVKAAARPPWAAETVGLADQQAQAYQHRLFSVLPSVKVPLLSSSLHRKTQDLRCLMLVKTVQVTENDCLLDHVILSG